MQDEQPKIKKVWELPDAPPHPEMTAGVVVNPDNISAGDFLMMICSSAVRLEMTPMGPNVARIDNDPSFGGVMSVRAFCYPFIACMVLTGKWQGTRMAIDIRRHKLVKVTQHFVRCMMEPKQVMDLEEQKANKPKKKKKKAGYGPQPLPEELMRQLFGRDAMKNAFKAVAPPDMDNPEANLRDALEAGGWEIRDPRDHPDDAQGQPPQYPDNLPPPDDLNDVPDEDWDEEGDEEGDGVGARI